MTRVTTTRRSALGATLRGAWRAARWRKNLPLALLVLGGALAAGAPRGATLALTLLTTMVAAAFMTHVNILTDAELDRRDKPHLIAWLVRDPAATRRIMAGELLATGLGIATLLAFGAWTAALGVLGFTAASVLYSYNFLARDPVGRRWKVSASGHAASVTLGYTSLWIAGYGCAGAGGLTGLLALAPHFIAASLSEYALFLAESAIDGRAERERGLPTLAARLGRIWSARVGLLAAGVTLLVPPLWADGDPGRAPALALALVAGGTVRALTILVLCVELPAAVDRRVRSALPDLCFFGARALTVVVLALA